MALSTITVLLGSCSASNQSATPETNTQQTAQQTPATQNFPKPLVPVSTAQKASPANGLSPAARLAPVPGLIQPTNSKERLAQVTSGRRDPFSTIIASPIIVAAPKPAPRIVPKLPPVPVLTNPPSLPRLAAAPLPAVAPVAPLPTVVTAPPTSLAEAIAVTGVVQLGTKVSLIVKVPEEISSRSVSVGDRLANGRVKVKRIEVKTADPIVVFEENGLEVFKTIGAPVASLL